MQTSPSALKILPIRASVRTREQRADQQYHDADANRSIGKIEDQKWAPFADMQVQEIDHEAKADAIEDIAKRAAKHQPKRSEEHTSELQSLMRISYAVFCLKKKNTKTTTKQ